MWARMAAETGVSPLRTMPLNGLGAVLRPVRARASWGVNDRCHCCGLELFGPVPGPCRSARSAAGTATPARPSIGASAVTRPSSTPSAPAPWLGCILRGRNPTSKTGRPIGCAAHRSPMIYLRPCVGARAHGLDSRVLKKPTASTLFGGRARPPVVIITDYEHELRSYFVVTSSRALPPTYELRRSPLLYRSGFRRSSRRGRM